MEKKYFKLTIAYDGSHYCGWQVQKNAVAVQEVMMEAGKHFLEEGFTVTGSSRTDSGVHALGYVASVVTTKNITARKIQGAFNAHLPRDIIVHECVEVNEGFHPRYLAKEKHYRYTIYNNDYPIPQYLQYAHYYRKPLDVQAMQEAGKAFIGTYDFVGFSSIKLTVEDTVRTINNLSVTKEGNMIHIDVCGDGFLYNMVRIIAGSLIQVGLHKTNPKDMKEIILSKDRNKAKHTAPAKGLTLVQVKYDDEWMITD